MARLKFVIGEREIIREKYRKQLEDEYVQKKTQEYLAKVHEANIKVRRIKEIRN